jgi:UDP:flavonoid glycosyltransferase YjiC (YdhE family)
MRVVVAPVGSRGDFQPMLALSVALRAAGHEVLLLTPPSLASEAAAFGVPSAPTAFDLRALLEETPFEASPLRAARALFAQAPGWMAQAAEAGVEACRGADLLVGAGAQLVGASIAERLRIPYAFVIYSPQMLRSSYHPPMVVPTSGLPRVLNRLLWAAFGAAAARTLGRPLRRSRRALQLPPLRDLYRHVVPLGATLLAADPELAPLPPDVALAHPPTGALHLEDLRALPAGLEAFLRAGPPPVYLGFGSMPDATPEATTALFLEAARRVGCRLVLAGGWAGFGGDPAEAVVLGERALAVGPVSHALLFPRVAAAVHHGGAGTTSAAARAGLPQVLVPHLFDQFLWGRSVAQAGVGLAVARKGLTATSLATALAQVLERPSFAERARALGAAVRARDAGARMVQALEGIVRAATS